MTTTLTAPAPTLAPAANAAAYGVENFLPAGSLVGMDASERDYVIGAAHRERADAVRDADYEDILLDAQERDMLRRWRSACERRGGTREERIATRAALAAEALGHAFTADEIVGWYARSAAMGCADSLLGYKTLEDLYRARVVPNARFREAYLRKQGTVAAVSLNRIARELGFTREHPTRGTVPDQTAARRLLGVEGKGSSAGRRPSMTMFIDYEQAVTLARVLDIAPTTAGV